VSSREREEITRYLEGEKVLVKAVLPYEGRLERSLAESIAESMRKRTLPPSLRGLLDALRGGERLDTERIAGLLAAAEGGEDEAVMEVAEAAARDYFGGRVAALVGMRLDVEGVGAPARRGLAALAEEMREQGFVHLLLDLGEMADLPWEGSELGEVLGRDMIVVITAASLPRRAGGLVSEGVVRQFLLRRDDVFSLDAGGLAEEIVFLRDNRPGPIGSGNLIPLLDARLEAAGEAGARRARSVLAACRLVLGDAFLPAPPALWREGGLAGANLLVLDATSRPLAEAAGEVEKRARESGLSIVRVRRGGV